MTKIFIYKSGELAFKVNYNLYISYNFYIHLYVQNAIKHLTTPRWLIGERSRTGVSRKLA